ncbi:MAG: hypothetical protein QM315_02485, partial [Bacillota bacterium]|nr:hypothetical protein [Bacillota bacterium]
VIGNRQQFNYIIPFDAGKSNISQARNTRNRTRGDIIPKTQRVIRVFSVMPGDMLQRLAAYRQLWNG